MPRYFFDTADGDSDTDKEGVVLTSDQDAILVAVRFAGSMISDQPEILTDRDELAVRVRKGSTQPLATVRVQLTTS
jgi:hypothetical protein